MRCQNDVAEYPWVRRPVGEALERQVGSRAPSVEADVLVPLQQSVVTGMFGLACGAALGAVVFWEWLAALVGGFCGFIVAGGGMWALLLAEHRRLLWLVERQMAGVEGDGGGVEELRVVIAHEDEVGRVVRMQYLNVAGVSGEELREFARAVVGGAPLTVAYWTGTGALFSRAEYEVLMAELVRAGLVRDGGHQGRALTAAGRCVLRRVAEG